MKEIDQKTQIELQRLEENLWRAETRFDKELMDATFAKDFFEFGRSDRKWSREELINTSGDTINAVLPLDDFAVRKLSQDIYQVTYNSIVKYGGETEYGRRSSIWSLSDTGWQLLFHQGTPYDGNA